MRVFLNSLPKSGTNLVSKLLDGLGCEYSGKSVAASSLYGRYELIKKLTRLACVTGGNNIPIGLEIPACVSSRWLNKYFSSVAIGGYVTGHAAFSGQLVTILSELNYKVVQVIRNPYDVIYSYVNYIVEDENKYYPTHTTLNTITFEERVQLMTSGGYLVDRNIYIRGLREVLMSQDGWFNSPNVLTVRFEDLVGSQGGGDSTLQEITIKNICDFLAVDFSLGMECSKTLYGGTHTFRKGMIGTSNEVFSAELKNLIKNEIKGISFLTELGYMNES